jgi:glycine betaine/proline transport system substrate-binding protein
MARVLLNGLGYDSKQTSAVQQIIFAGIRQASGHLPRLLETGDGQQHCALSRCQPGQSPGQAELADARRRWRCRITWRAGLKTFADIAKFKDQLGGKIYGIEPGSEANTTIKSMIETNHFGLKDFKIVESGEAGMLAAVQRAVNRKEFVVFVGWTRTR